MSESEEVFKANDKEIRLFEKEKLDLYKGTFVVCIVYGLAAFILLAVILLTEWGKEYIYDKFAPAVITYIVGSLIIILYLLNTIYSLRPRRVGKDADNDENIICPDYWKLEVVPQTTRTSIISNNTDGTGTSSTKIIPEISREGSTELKYRCVYDKKVYGEAADLYNMKNTLYSKSDNAEKPYLPGFTSNTDAKKYITASVNNSTKPEYSIKIPDKESPNWKSLKNYAKFSGIYNDNTATNTGYDFHIGKTGYIDTGGVTSANVVSKYKSDVPLNCDVVYPKVLGVLDEKTKEGNEISCEYAKQCGVSWSSLNCKK